MPSPYHILRSQWRKFWSQHWPRQTFVIVGTIVGVGIFYWPFISSVWNPLSKLPEDQRHLYDVENTYYAKKRKEEAMLRKQEIEARKNRGPSQSSQDS